MDPLQAGITAAREGHQAEARALLKEALQANPLSEQGWLWMSAVVDTTPERRVCLERVLNINPGNHTARAGLERLDVPDGPGDEYPSYLRTPRPAPVVAREVSTAAPGTSTSRIEQPPSPHQMSTLAMEPVEPGPRRIRRLPSGSEPQDDLARLRAARYQAVSSPDDASSSETDSFTALVLIGGLSITALAGALMLGLLWIIGWPP
jgi:hypothetical protein